MIGAVRPYPAVNYEELGAAVALLSKTAATATVTHELSGELYKSRSGWFLLHVPNDFGVGAFKALDVTGAELPKNVDDRYNAHISVFRDDEVADLGEEITERGKHFHWTPGPLKSCKPDGWPGVAEVYFVEVHSPELEALRVSYGLPRLPTKNGESYPFHITVAIVRETSLKAAWEQGGKLEASSTIENVLAKDAGPPCPKCKGPTIYWRQYGGDSNVECDKCGHRFSHESAAARFPKLAAADMTAEDLARFFHDTYESLAPGFGYETRKDTRDFKADSNNGKLMIAVAGKVLEKIQTKTAGERKRVATRADAPGHSITHHSCGHTVRCRCLGPHDEYDVDESCGMCDMMEPGKKTAADFLPALQQAKAESDTGNYGAKSFQLNKLMTQAPADFVVDSNSYSPHPGITHVPTGFRFHVPRSAIPPQIVKTAAAKIPDGIEIDRPKGYRKTFGTPDGPKKVTYPTDYGFFVGVNNPDDDEEADVFVGTGDLYGRFQKGDNLSGTWKPDERKWYWGLTQEELDAVKAMYDHPASNLLRDWVTFDSPEALKEDLPAVKTAVEDALPDYMQSLVPADTPAHWADLVDGYNKQASVGALLGRLPGMVRGAGGAVRSGLQAGRQSLRGAVGAMPQQSTPSAVSRFVASVPQTAPMTVGTAAKGLAKAVTAPKYPGLDAVPGAAARSYERLRNTAGTVLRRGGTAAGIAGVAGVIPTLTHPLQTVGDKQLDTLRNMMPSFGEPQANPSQQAGLLASISHQVADYADPRIRSLYPRMLKDTITGGPDSDPVGQLVGTAVRSGLTTHIRDRYHQQTENPTAFGRMTQLARSTTPFGIGTQLLERALAKPATGNELPEALADKAKRIDWLSHATDVPKSPYVTAMMPWQ